jgi:hypothetical protein
LYRLKFDETDRRDVDHEEQDGEGQVVKNQYDRRGLCRGCREEYHAYYDAEDKEAHDCADENELCAVQE